MLSLLNRLPLSQWLQAYNRETFVSDLIAGVVVAIMLIPQGMAYAMLAGMPAEYGLYCAILPLLLYALLGSSRSLAVGPVAIASLMVASSLGQLQLQTSSEYIRYAVNLSLLCAGFLLLLRLLRLGDIVNFISHSVITGFTSAAAVVIAISQLRHILGLPRPPEGEFLPALTSMLQQLDQLNIASLLVGCGAIAVLWWSKKPLAKVLQECRWPQAISQPLSKAGPMFAVVAGTLVVWLGELDQSLAVSTVGLIPEGLPSISFGLIDPSTWQVLALPALLIALVGFLESVSVGTALASKRQERINPNQELLALGAANLGAAFSGTFAVAGGLGRSMVNHSAGAQTTIASLISALLVAVTLLWLTPLFYYLPKAVLGAIVIMAVLPLIDLSGIRKCWQFNKADALTLALTFTLVLVLGVELGILLGIGSSILLLIYRASQPHIAIVGRVGESEHFRNIARHQVSTLNDTLALRVDESLYFANTRYVESFILQQCAAAPHLRHVVLICSAVNFIDASALETLENLIIKLRNQQVRLHLAEVKGPVMDQLKNTELLQELAPGQVFFTTDEAMRSLAANPPAAHPA
ncbi:SulP family inorganic anion transporter [Marinobacterium jannaschii]|uniref:SulP family inorganic anion transporter n=1 Tax=Marinobacterium jannaschii TaxID=64970 RepID=UPI0004805D1E|nr:sulfate permease [Marinobacterium jannaschii]